MMFYSRWFLSLSAGICLVILTSVFIPLQSSAEGFSQLDFDTAVVAAAKKPRSESASIKEVKKVETVQKPTIRLLNSTDLIRLANSQDEFVQGKRDEEAAPRK